MSLNIIINTLPPGGLQAGGPTFVVPGDLSSFALDPYGRRVITTAQTFGRLDLRALYGRTPVYLQFLTVAAAPTSGVTGYQVAELYTNAQQVIPLVLPGTEIEAAFISNIYLDENAILAVVPQGVATPVQAQLVLTIQPITQRDRSRLQCCYNGSPAVPVTPAELPPEITNMVPDSAIEGGPIVALAAGLNFQPGDVVEFERLGVVTPLTTTFIDPTTLDTLLDPNPLVAGTYNVRVNRGGSIFPQSVTFTVLSV